MSINRRIGLGLLITIFLVGGAFLFERATIVNGGNNGKLVPVVKNAQTIAYLDSGTVKQLHQQELSLKQGFGNNDNEVSLEFALGSAGAVDFKYIDITGVGNSEKLQLGPNKIAGIVLAANPDSTIAMINKAGGNLVMLPEIAKLTVVN